MDTKPPPTSFSRTESGPTEASPTADTSGAALSGAWRGALVLLACVSIALAGTHLATEMLRHSFPSIWRALHEWGE